MLRPQGGSGLLAGFVVLARRTHRLAPSLTAVCCRLAALQASRLRVCTRPSTRS